MKKLNRAGRKRSRKENKVFSQTKMNPCTTVQDLVENLIKYTSPNK